MFVAMTVPRTESNYFSMASHCRPVSCKFLMELERVTRDGNSVHRLKGLLMQFVGLYISRLGDQSYPNLVAFVSTLSANMLVSKLMF